ncbi:MAG TPA: protoporphyrinogen oxidase [bacterium]
MSRDRFRLIVIGGGVSGLAAAHRALELAGEDGRRLDLTLLEAGARFGGVIASSAREGFLLEAGPDAFIADKPWALELCQRLGLGGELIGTNQDCRRSFIVHRGRLSPVPEGIYLGLPVRFSTLFRTDLVGWRAKLRMAGEWWIPPRSGEDDESVGGFVRRRFGREALERLAQPMISGIYTADPDRLSLGATLPQLAEMERRHGSLIRALRARVRARDGAMRGASGPRYGLFVSLRGGMESIIGALLGRLRERGARLRAGCRVRSVARPEPGGSWSVRAAPGETLEADAVCVALPAPQAAAVLAEALPEAAALIGGIRYESVATVNVAFRRTDVLHALDGFGFVVPAVEGRPLIGCTFASTKFPHRAPAGSVLVRAFVGGAMHRPVASLGEEALGAMVVKELAELIGSRSAPLWISVHRYPEAMPQYAVGHPSRMADLDRRLAGVPGLALAGNGYRGIGVPDCVRQGEQAAERLWAAAGAVELSR